MLSRMGSLIGFGRLVSFLGRRGKSGCEQPRECPECPECGSALLRPLEDTHLVCSWCERMWSALDE